MRSDLIITRIPQHTEEWFAFRKNGIGGSEAATVLGLDRYNTVMRVFHEKVGTISHQTFDNSKMFFGRYMEDKIAELWEYYDGTDEGWIENFKNNKIIRQCRKVNGYVVNPSYPWLFGSFDRVQNIKGGVNLITGTPLETEAVLEIKTLSYWSSQVWEDGLPINFLIQVHIYMIILETSYAEIAILKDGNTFQVEKIMRDDSLAEKIIDITKAFWQNRVIPAKEAYAKMKEAEKQGNIGEAEKWEGEIQKMEPEPDKTEAYSDFMSERFLKTRSSIDGTIDTYDLALRDKMLLSINGRIDDERQLIKNHLIKEMVNAGAEMIDFGKLGSCTYGERKGAKNRSFSNRLKEKPSEERIEQEFNKLDLDMNG